MVIRSVEQDEMMMLMTMINKEEKKEPLGRLEKQITIQKRINQWGSYKKQVRFGSATLQIAGSLRAWFTVS
uniref:Uncharacterized protein n=1 Tax=Caenorhabditis japonica TaxID=281687 RepID=A0A2Q4SU14_CAEJA